MFTDTARESAPAPQIAKDGDLNVALGGVRLEPGSRDDARAWRFTTELVVSLGGRVQPVRVSLGVELPDARTETTPSSETKPGL